MLRTEGSQERLDDLAELKQSIYEWETTVGEETDMVSYLRHIALFTNTDTLTGSDKVKLMTVHSAKGWSFRMSSYVRCVKESSHRAKYAQRAVWKKKEDWLLWR
jgi:superfamily I DNA/RNA helicase